MKRFTHYTLTPGIDYDVGFSPTASYDEAEAKTEREFFASGSPAYALLGHLGKGKHDYDVLMVSYDPEKLALRVRRMFGVEVSWDGENQLVFKT